MRTVALTAVLHKEENGWTALCHELDIASQGDDIESARSNLREAVELFLEAASAEEIQDRFATETYFTQFVVALDDAILLEKQQS